MNDTIHAGGCLCGQVRWQAKAAPVNVRLRHCRNCQRATGGPFFARAVFLADAVSWVGETTSWPTSPRIDRLSCARCGTPMFARPKDPPRRIAISLATSDDPNALPPEMHIWVSEKLDWVQIDDGLAQYPQSA